jgi:hypothetical protein
MSDQVVDLELKDPLDPRELKALQVQLQILELLVLCQVDLTIMEATATQ